MCTIGILKYEVSMIFLNKTGTQATKKTCCKQFPYQNTYSYYVKMKLF